MELLNAHLTRQADLIPLSALGKKVNVIGAGAIGSFTVLALAKMGFSNIEVWDDDVVSIENMNSQYYRRSDIGKPKVKALRELIMDFTGIEIKTNPFRYEGGPLSGIIISAVDSMAARKMIFESQITSFNCEAIVDPRMGAEDARLHLVTPTDTQDAEEYKNTLYTDEGAVQERCTAKATMYTVNLIAGYTAKIVKQLACDENTIDGLTWSIKHDDLEVLGKSDSYTYVLQERLAEIESDARVWEERYRDQREQNANWSEAYSNIEKELRETKNKMASIEVPLNHWQRKKIKKMMEAGDSMDKIEKSWFDEAYDRMMGENRVVEADALQSYQYAVNNVAYQYAVNNVANQINQEIAGEPTQTDVVQAIEQQPEPSEVVDEAPADEIPENIWEWAEPDDEDADEGIF